MGSWYWIGVLAGLGASLGLLLTGIVPRRGAAVAAAAASLAVALAGFALLGWTEALGGLIGGLGGSLGGAVLVRGALVRGGTRSGLAALVGLAAAVAAGLAFVPALGYLETIALPGLALRLRSREPKRYAGLRTLARD